MLNLSKTAFLYVGLAMGVFVGLGLIALPGPHGGMVFLLPYILGLLNPFKTDLLSFVLVYPPVLLLAFSGFLKNPAWRIICSHVAILALTTFFFRFLQSVYAPVRYFAFITGALFFASIAVAFVQPFFLMRTNSRGKKFVMGESLLFAMLIILSAIALSFKWLPEKKVPLKTHSCETNLELIGQLFEIYLLSHSDYPADGWSDAIVEQASDLEQAFLACPLATEGKCHYAMNPNVRRDASPNTVLLFESESGWNLYGGIEHANTKRHSGCYVLFNDKHVEFVAPENLDRLNWTGSGALSIFR